MNTTTTLLAAILGASLIACAPSEPEVPAPLPFTCAGKYQGRIDMPEQSVRLAAKARALAMGENKTGGGVDGGYYLDGAFAFQVDAACNAYAGAFIVHGTRFAVRGGTIKPDGSFAFTASGLPVAGQVTNKAITGRAMEPGRETWVYGNLVGEVVQ